jgi:ABC-type transport system involved in multi-copper enzyme maturation permease subunit
VNLMTVEMRRALRRRAVRVLIAIAVVGCAFAGVVAYFGSAGKTVTQLRLDDEGNPAVMSDWWIADANEGFLAVAMFFLFLGGFFGGATVAGAEWRAGTMTTVLTWEPRRLRLHGARTCGAAVLAFAISFALQVLFLASFLPAVFLNGTTEGVDGPFWLGLAVVMIRTSVLTAGAAVLAIALATVGRNTAFAVITMFAWLIVVEGLIRGLKPSLARWLWAENLGTVMTWAQLETGEFSRGPLVAGATLLVYLAVIVGIATASFERRDIAAAS